MANDTYTANADGTCYVGMFSRPLWSIDIAEGEFKNISSINTVQDIFVAQYPSVLQSAQPFTNWSGGVIAEDVGELGSYITMGSGHLINGATYCSGVCVFDLADLTWRLRAYSEQPVNSGDPMNQFGETTDPSTAPYPFVPHVYDGLVYQPASQGGGSHGKIIQNWYPGTSLTGRYCAHSYDLDPVNQMPTRVADVTGFGGNGYPAAAADYGRGGYWIMSNNGAGRTTFVSFSDFTRTDYMFEFPSYGEGNLIYIPAPYDCLVMIGTKDSNGVNFSFRVSRIINNAPTSWVAATLINNPISQTRYQSGGVWSEILNCIVSYPARGSYDVYKIIPPSPDDVTTGSWTFETETMTGKAGAVPSDNGKTSDGAWSRFIEHKPSRTFIWCDRWDQPVQAWRLTGMV